MPNTPLHPTRRAFLQSAAAGAALLPLYGPAYGQDGQLVSLEDYERQFFTGPEWAFILAATARLIPSEGDGPGALEARVPVFIDLQLAGPYGVGADWYMEGPHYPQAPAERGFQSPLGPAEIYRQAIPAFNDWCTRRYGAEFASLEPAQQDEALQTLEGKKSPAGGGQSSNSGSSEEVSESSGGSAPLTAGSSNTLALPPELRDFFSLLLQNTKEGYFADPKYGGNHEMQPWLYIGFPGARASYLEWVDQWNVPYPLGPVSISGERA